jgi:hypothetical protein
VPAVPASKRERSVSATVIPLPVRQRTELLTLDEIIDSLEPLDCEHRFADQTLEMPIRPSRSRATARSSFVSRASSAAHSRRVARAAES